MKLCGKSLPIRSKYKEISEKKCQKEFGHAGNCEEFPFLNELSQSNPRVANKIKRDATKTTGAAWKSEDAGPNRIDRWVMLQDDDSLLKYGINMKVLKPTVVSKLKEKAATYDDCMEVAAKLTWHTYQMPDAPKCGQAIQTYLENRFGKLQSGATTCIVCKDNLSFSLFENAQRGKAEIETAHSNPREHNQFNVGFAHRECNIAQGNKTLPEFYEWITGIMQRINNQKS